MFANSSRDSPTNDGLPVAVAGAGRKASKAFKAFSMRALIRALCGQGNGLPGDTDGYYKLAIQANRVQFAKKGPNVVFCRDLSAVCQVDVVSAQFRCLVSMSSVDV